MVCFFKGTAGAGSQRIGPVGSQKGFPLSMPKKSIVSSGLTLFVLRVRPHQWGTWVLSFTFISRHAVLSDFFPCSVTCHFMALFDVPGMEGAILIFALNHGLLSRNPVLESEGVEFWATMPF